MMRVVGTQNGFQHDYSPRRIRTYHAVTCFPSMELYPGVFLYVCQMERQLVTLRSCVALQSDWNVTVSASLSCRHLHTGQMRANSAALKATKQP